jgi:hypothetical protein
VLRRQAGTRGPQMDGRQAGIFDQVSPLPCQMLFNDPGTPCAQRHGSAIGLVLGKQTTPEADGAASNFACGVLLPQCSPHTSD